MLSSPAAPDDDRPRAAADGSSEIVGIAACIFRGPREPSTLGAYMTAPRSLRTWPPAMWSSSPS